MSKYYSVVVSMEIETETGKIRKVKEQYLVDALSCTEAEAKLVQKFSDDKVSIDYEVVKVSETPIKSIIN